MATPPKGPRLGGSPSHERLMLANLATSLFEHGRIRTTETKAKRLRPFAERLITKARKQDLHNRREVMKVIRDKDVVHRLFDEIGPHFADRPGGYTRIIKTVPRKGDNAPMAVIELVPERTATAEAEQARGTRFARDQAPAAGATAAGDTAAGDTAAEDTAAEDAPAAGEPALDEDAPAAGEPALDEDETAEAVQATAEAGTVAGSPAATAPGDAGQVPPGQADDDRHGNGS